jgi:hypothetical protein
VVTHRFLTVFVVSSFIACAPETADEAAPEAEVLVNLAEGVQLLTPGRAHVP